MGVCKKTIDNLLLAFTIWMSAELMSEEISDYYLKASIDAKKTAILNFPSSGSSPQYRFTTAVTVQGEILASQHFLEYDPHWQLGEKLEEKAYFYKTLSSYGPISLISKIFDK